MGTCLVCHNGAKASNQCKACHREAPKASPQSLTISAIAGNS
jgi:hypothetical protein